jgi:hypothetical protein
MLTKPQRMLIDDLIEEFAGCGTAEPFMLGNETRAAIEAMRNHVRWMENVADEVSVECRECGSKFVPPFEGVTWCYDCWWAEIGSRI